MALIVSAPLQPRADWYKAGANDPYLDPAHEAFVEAVNIFKNQFSHDERKKTVVDNASNIEDIRDKLRQAQSKYEASHGNNKIQKWITKASARVQLYGNVMDVLAQHHPEYTALAWGTMKLVFTAVMNHDTMLSSFCKALSQIADVLPRTELATVLYPTAKMKSAVAELYAHIIRFLIRATKWYQESKMSHILHSITRPWELRYQDLVENIVRCSQTVENIAVAASRAEQRDIHLRVLEVMNKQQQSDALLVEIKNMLIQSQSLHSSGQIDTSFQLADLQFSRILNFVRGEKSRLTMSDPGKHIIGPSRRNTTVRTNMFWLGPKFQTWGSRPESSLIIVKGNYHNRKDIQNFCHNLLKTLHTAKVPVLCAMKPGAAEVKSVTVEEVLRHLVAQALRLNEDCRSERALSLTCRKVETANKPSEWLDILAACVSGISSLCILVDLEITRADVDSTQQPFAWPCAFISLIQQLKSRGVKTMVKVLLVGYGPIFLHTINGNNLHDLVVPVRQVKRGGPKQKRLASRVSINSSGKRGRGGGFISPLRALFPEQPNGPIV